jgi:hypothetical protein
MDLKKKNIAFGSTPIINNFYWSSALKQNGYKAKTVMFDKSTFITKNILWDIKIKFKVSENKLLQSILKIDAGIRAVYLFFKCLLQFDIFVMSFDGFLIGKIPVIWRLQSYLFKILNKKSIVIPYGGDSYVYNQVRSKALQNGLIESYPMSKKQQKKIQNRVNYWKKHATIILPGIMCADIFGDSEILCLAKNPKIPSPLIIDADTWRSNRNSLKDGGVIEIAHMPNHRGFKGTRKIIEVVTELEKEGFNLKFSLIEGLSNDEVRVLLRDKIHILIDQINAIGYGLNAIEGMANSCVVMANISDSRYTHMYAGTYLDVCPIISINDSSLKSELKSILLDHERINKLSYLSREYVEKYHSYDYFTVVFQEVAEFIYKQ